MLKPGKKTELTEEVILEIRKFVLAGTLYIKIQQMLDINPNTWDTWVFKDYKGFREMLNNWKRERILRKSEQISEEILDINHIGDNGIDSRILSIKQKESEFVRSTLDKSNYSKRLENTGKNGEDLFPKPLLTYALSDNLRNTEDTSPKEENQDNTGRD